MNRDVVLNKIETIERCVKRVNEVYQDIDAHLQDFTKQDSIVLNVQRACEACIDLAMHMVSEKRLGIPQTSRDAFDLLREHQLIDLSIATKMKAMIGFRNIAVHDYQALSLTILKEIVENHLNDFTEFARQALRAN